MRVDVAVIGVGAMGSAALWCVAARGAGAVGFERFEPGHDRGSSHGDSRIIRTAYYEGPQYVPLVQRAFALWRQLEHESGASLLTMTGALMIGPPDRELVAGALASARQHGLAHEVLSADEAGRRYPQFRFSSGEVALYEEQAGVLRPEEAVRAMARRAIDLGATVHRHTAVEAIEPDGDGVSVSAGRCRYRARRAIVAAGAWTPNILPTLGVPLVVERQVFAWFPTRDPALFVPGRFPVFMHEVAPGRIRYGIAAPDGAAIKVGIHHEGAQTTADGVNRAIYPEDLDPLQRYVRDRLPGVEPAAARGQVCLYTNTPDYHFLIGALPGLPAATVISACSGHGFKYAPVLGDAAVDLALSGHTSYPIDLFAPGRFASGMAH